LHSNSTLQQSEPTEKIKIAKTMKTPTSIAPTTNPKALAVCFSTARAANPDVKVREQLKQARSGLR
jgi:hypothetical protein